MKADLQHLREEAQQEFLEARTEESLLETKVRYLGRKGKLTQILRSMGKVSPDERPQVGKLANEVKQFLEDQFQSRLVHIHSQQQKHLLEEQIDITLSGRRSFLGRRHPLTLVMNEVTEIFSMMGFQMAHGSDVELDYYNFEALNIPKDHPARDMQDTFYISADVLLRTHTSPVQIHTMEEHSWPLKVVSLGACYRPDLDVTHSPVFHQIEGFMVDRQITFGDLKGVLAYFLREMFGKDTAIRFRPSYFPFTEPSAEVDIRCIMCRGEGCRVCSFTGWLEILGCGMIDPEVFRMVQYDPEEVTGFAFGMGIERVAMLKYSIHDIRLFFENDLRFLRQF